MGTEDGVSYKAFVRVDHFKRILSTISGVSVTIESIGMRLDMYHCSNNPGAKHQRTRVNTERNLVENRLCNVSAYIAAVSITILAHFINGLLP